VPSCVCAKDATDEGADDGVDLTICVGKIAVCRGIGCAVRDGAIVGNAGVTDGITDIGGASRIGLALVENIVGLACCAGVGVE